MKTNFVKAALALTMFSLTAPVTAHQSSTTEAVKSGNVPDQKVSVAKPETNQQKSNTAEQEYLVSTITQPSLDEACSSDDIFNVKLVILDNENGELRLYDADANLLGSQEVVFTDDERSGREVKNSLTGKTKDVKTVAPVDLENKKPANLNKQADKKLALPTEVSGKRIATLNPNLLNHKITNPLEDLQRHATDPIISFSTDDVIGRDKVSICLARHSLYLAVQQSKVDKICGSKMLKITCPDIDVFTTVILKGKCGFNRTTLETK